jgi:hypothetical protein
MRVSERAQDKGYEALDELRSCSIVALLASQPPPSKTLPARGASVRSLHLKESGGGAGRCLFGSSRFLEPCDFRLQDRDALIDFLQGKVVETLSDLM